MKHKETVTKSNFFHSYFYCSLFKAKLLTVFFASLNKCYFLAEHKYQFAISVQFQLNNFYFIFLSLVALQLISIFWIIIKHPTLVILIKRKMITFYVSLFGLVLTNVSFMVLFSLQVRTLNNFNYFSGISNILVEKRKNFAYV